jgi:hypothetical protein
VPELWTLGIIYTFMKIILSLLAFSLFLTACSKSNGDAAMSRKITGAWADASDKTPFTISSDGSYSIVTGGVNHAGTWQIRDGVFIMMHTNLDHAVERMRIVRVDDHQFVIGEEKGTRTSTLTR